jgi:hypothetical protein
MELRRKEVPPPAPLPEFAEPEPRKPLVLLRNTERSLRLKTVETLVPLLPEPVATNLEEVSVVAEESLTKLADLNLDEITDADLHPARILVGLLFIGFGALAMTFLLLYLYTLHPELDAAEQVRQYWYQYVWFAGLGIAGLFVVGREAMRPKEFDK